MASITLCSAIQIAFSSHRSSGASRAGVVRIVAAPKVASASVVVVDEER